MPAVTKALNADKGGTFQLSVRLRDPDGSPVDLTGYTAELLVMDPADGGLWDTKAGTVDASGWIVVTVADEATGLWPTGKQAYRLQIEEPGGNLQWVLMGALHVRSGFDA